MKSVLKSIVIVSLVMGGTTWAATSSLAGKKADKAGGFVYTYKYFCSAGSQGSFDLNAKTDEEAKKLAEARAKRICEE